MTLVEELIDVAAVAAKARAEIRDQSLQNPWPPSGMNASRLSEDGPVPISVITLRSTSKTWNRSRPV
jgi:hypothetical protein